MTGIELAEAVGAVRRFSRFYTKKIGVLEEGLYKSPLSLTEVRVLYELAHWDGPTAAELCTELGLDQGYLSRILGKFNELGLLERVPSPTDGRRSLLYLTPAGRETFALVNRVSAEEVGAMLAGLSPAELTELVVALGRVETLLGGRPEPAAPFSLRPPRSGDMGWIVHRQGIIYTEEYGWTNEFEALVAQIVADFVQNFKPDRERCWVAERNGAVVGSVFLVNVSETVAKLRLLYVERTARGLGIGSALVNEVITAARQLGYQTLTLWTNDILVSARKIYEAIGFRLVEEEKHHSFGHDLVGQYWSLEL